MNISKFTHTHNQVHRCKQTRLEKTKKAGTFNSNQIYRKGKTYFEYVMAMKIFFDTAFILLTYISFEFCEQTRKR